ncbi:hypothetical protein [Pannonibacter indicus]|jgi:hypothetical protein|uniref:hypothetical protein n=1 Tax=Pannonibacter indicus TaxID=466044 RepID=UPI00391B1F3A
MREQLIHFPCCRYCVFIGDDEAILVFEKPCATPNSNERNLLLDEAHRLLQRNQAVSRSAVPGESS